MYCRPRLHLASLPPSFVLFHFRTLAIMADVIIIGGGLAGTVVASRLHQKKPSLSILLIEAGIDPTGHPHVVVPADAAMLYGSELDYNYRTTPQTHLDGKPKVNVGFKGLGGGSVINNGSDGNARAVTTWLIKPRWMDKRRRQRLR
jgi:flavin-dependent dehydrogenase